MKTTITGCARCGQDHPGLEFQRLDRPMKDPDVVWTHWAPCPINGQPIMLKIEETPKTVGPSEYKDGT